MWRIPLSDLNYGVEEEQAVVAVLRSGWLTMGAVTEQFESAMAEYLGVRHAIAVANCTCALEMSLEVLLQKCGAGAEASVLMPSLTFVATVNAAVQRGALPVFCDLPQPDAPLLNAEIIKAELDRRRCSGVVLVHYAGFDADSEAVASLCRERGLFLVEDAAHAIGAWNRGGRHLGTVGDIGCFSFFSNKNLATGEGGLLATDDDELAKHLRLLRSHGMTSLTHERHVTRSHGYDVVVTGHNFRPTEITSALGLEQLKKLDGANARRRHLTRKYISCLQGNAHIRVALEGSSDIEKSACHILPLLCSSSELRDRCRRVLTTAGIQTSHHYPPVHSFSCYRTLLRELELPSTEEFASRQITLPLHPKLSDSAIDEICGILLQETGRAA